MSIFSPQPRGPIYQTEAGKTVFGVLAKFANPGALVHGAEAVRDAGYKRWDTHSPFPVHDMEESMGIKGWLLTPLMYIIGGGALTGFLVAGAMQYWITHVDYEMVVQGKPTDAWESFVPVSFELTVLFTAFSTLIGMLALNGLPRHHHPLFTSDAFLKASDDEFFVSIEASDPAFDPEKTRSLLADAGALSIELVEED
ncbi:MAG: DUF3341 domain-containing protein [Planctomycetota bacterium]